jgi:hypothetical protein
MSRNRLTAWLPVCIKRGALLLASAGVLALSACGGGSGAPNNPYEPGPTTPGPLTVVPDEAIAFAGTPLVLSISGGTPPYQAFSANPAALPIPAQNVNGNTLVLLANNVAVQEAANVTIRDSGGQSAVSEIIVRPAVLLPASITIVPNSAPCTGGDVCSGQTSVATVRVTGATGSPIAGRSVRFDVVQGQFALQTTNPGSPLAATQTVISDANGDARVVISVPANTPTQIGLLRATELSTGSQVTAQFIIAQVVSGDGILSVVPSGATTINGPFQGVCSAGVRVSHYIFGGTPPYRIVVNFPDVVTLVNGIVNTNGGGFDIITNGTCFSGLTFAITDASGRTLLSPPTVNNIEGTTPQTPPTPPPTPTTLASNPPTTTAIGCSGRTFQFTVTGGTPPYSAVVALNPQTSPVTTPVVTQGGGGVFTVSFPAGPPTIPPGTTALFTVTDSQNPQRSASSTITCN